MMRVMGKILPITPLIPISPLRPTAFDMETGHEGEVASYPTPEELWNRTFAKPNAWRDRFSTVPFEDKGGYFQSRYFQDIAVERVMEAIAAGLIRILLTLAIREGRRG